MNNKNMDKKYAIKRGLKVFKNMKCQLLVLVLLYIALGVCGFIFPIIEANLIASITSATLNKVLLFAIGFILVVILEEMIEYFAMLYWQKKIRKKFYLILERK